MVFIDLFSSLFDYWYYHFLQVIIYIDGVRAIFLVQNSAPPAQTGVLITAQWKT